MEESWMLFMKMPELGGLGVHELFIFVNDVEDSRGFPTLLEANFVVNGSKDFLVLFNECSSVLQSVIEL